MSLLVSALHANCIARVLGYMLHRTGVGVAQTGHLAPQLVLLVVEVPPQVTHAYEPSRDQHGHGAPHEPARGADVRAQ